MNIPNITALAIYAFIIVLGFYVSLKYGSLMIKKTGFVLAQSIVAATINLVIGILAMIGWFIYAWGVEEKLFSYLFFGGIVVGMVLLVFSITALLLILLWKRYKLIKNYHENLT
ncbi:hypothetical protein [Salipaludibacillus daqingensis]|uniref:hypothetical protein n=1 Tax=Salipaludibacillus daqingensis TaxID=3041001 RepID=UPI0024755A8C|nr:hypothetical protein [Salipaludibacillus daqingensis]